MANDVGIFPVLAGLGWSVNKTPTWQTRVQRAVSGRESRALDYPFPLWIFELTYDFLRDTPTGSGAADLRVLLGFYCACQGAFGNFLYSDPTDNFVANQGIGTGNGSAKQFQLIRTLSDAEKGPTFTEAILAPGAIQSVSLNGVAQSSNSYSANGGNGVLTFTAAPATGAVITASFFYYFRCRFVDDAVGFENFMSGLWQLKKLSFISTR